MTTSVQQHAYMRLQDRVDPPTGKERVNFDRLIGSWQHTDPDPQVLQAVSIATSGGALSAECFGTGLIVPPRNPAVPITTTFAASPGSHHQMSFFAEVDSGVMISRFQGNVNLGLLVLAGFHEFNDGSARSNFFSREFYYIASKGSTSRRVHIMNKPLRFHWSMSSAGEKFRGAKARAAQSGIPDLSAHVEFCCAAEECNIDSLLTAVGFHRPDPIVLAAALGVLTSKIKFMVACRSGLFSPTAFVQQVNTVSALTGGRICLNIVGGHTPEEQRYYGDFLTHDARYERTDEFLTICRDFWSDAPEVNFHGKYFQVEKGRLNTPFVSGKGPEIYVGGASPKAIELAVKHADCFWTLPARPAELFPRIRPVLDGGVEVGLLVSLIARSTRQEAVEAGQAILESLGSSPKRTHQEFAKRSDSVAFGSTLALAETQHEWLTNCLWTGAVPYLGAPAIALVGSFEEIARALWEYREAGITQFLFMGWPDLEEMKMFSRHVEPLVRAREAQVRQEAPCP